MPHADGQSHRDRTAVWPSLPFAAWHDTYTTLHMWTQIVGKIRLALSPPVNHWWHVTLYVTSRGLTTSPIPYGNRTFTMEFDFLAHHLRITTSEGGIHAMALAPRAVADFYHELMALLRTLGIEVVIRAIPDKPRQHFVYLSVHLSRPCWIDGSPLISMIGLPHVEGTFCLYAASLLVKPRPIE